MTASRLVVAARRSLHGCGRGPTVASVVRRGGHTTTASSVGIVGRRHHHHRNLFVSASAASDANSSASAAAAAAPSASASDGAVPMRGIGVDDLGGWRPPRGDRPPLPSSRLFSSAPFSTDAKSDDDGGSDSSSSSSSSAGSAGGEEKPPEKESASTSTSTAAEAEIMNKQTLDFQAETRQLLDIVTHSLYTDKEVFLRELISNSSDALEKLRHSQVANSGGNGGRENIDPELPLEIRVETDEVGGTLTVTDTGIGLTKDEMVDNLGTIARSGSKAFVNELAKSSAEGGAFDASRGIIGKFGVGFYSAFMVGDKVEVRSRPAYASADDDSSSSAPPPLVWSSTGEGGYDIGELSSNVRQDRGSSVVVHLKPTHTEFSDEKRVESVLKKYSNFVNFPIYLNGNRVNTMEAIWTHDPKDVTDETYTAFYKFIAHAYDEPLDRVHFRADAPLDINALFYIPSFHSEKYGMGRMEPGVSLYSRKVLIENAKNSHIVPEWMRFVKGVVDSEDLPLSISREKAQDTALIGKLRKALTRKFVSHLTNMARKQTDKYKDEFYKEYSFFLKEGICQDYDFQEPLSKLLYFETSKTMAGELTSLDEYVSRMEPSQKEMYYLCAPTRELALESPYLEAFEKAGREVIFVFSAIDDFVMANLEKFAGRDIVTVEKSNIDLGDDGNDKAEKDSKIDGEGSSKDASSSSTATSPTKLADPDAFCAWAKQTLGTAKVSTVKITNRLGSSPAIVTNNESGAMRRMMRLVDTQEGGGGGLSEGVPLPPQQLELNPKHPVIVGMENMRNDAGEGGESKLAEVCLNQIYDNSLVAAGLLDDGRSMLPRINDLLLCVVKGAGERGGGGTEPKKKEEEREEKKGSAATTTEPKEGGESAKVEEESKSSSDPTATKA